MRQRLDPTAQRGLVDLLGDTRAQIVEALRARARSVADLAADLELSEVAVRRHLQLLERDGFVVARTVRREGPGRPGAQYALTPRAYRLFPDRSAEFANDLLEYLEAEHGRRALLAFLRWRQKRQDARYGPALEAASEDLPGQVERLAELLSEDGFAARVDETPTPDGHTALTLTQGHCAIKDVAHEHPEVCAYEAALFKQLLGAKVSRRQTIAAGAGECVCHITPESQGSTTGANDGHQS